MSNNEPLNELTKDALSQGDELAKKLPALGHVTWLYTQSAQHKHFFLQDLESRVLPALVTEQGKLFFKNEGTGLPLAYISWAYLSEEAEAHFMATQRISVSHWKSGDRVWLVDLITPFGGTTDVLKELVEKIHPGKDVFMLSPGDDGTVGKRTIAEILETQQQADKADPASTTKH